MTQKWLELFHQIQIQYTAHIGPEPDVNWLSRLRGILLVAVNKWIIPQSKQELFNRLLSKLIKYQVEIGSRPN